MDNQEFENKVAFAIGTGRCGTQFLARIMAHEPEVKSVHERNALNETFHRYAKWYNLPIDDEGFLQTKFLEISEDLTKNNFSFEASAFLSVSTKELYERFGAKIILLVRSPEKVVNSYIAKGWYENDFYYSNKSLALGYQENNSFHHFLGRPVPIGDKFDEWKNMSRVGKLAWYWNELNLKAINILKEIPEDFWMVKKIEELNYEGYQEICAFLNIDSQISSYKFKLLSGDRHSFSNAPTISSWTETEIHEFQSEVLPMANHLGYEYEVNKMPVPTKVDNRSINIFLKKANKKVSNFLFPKSV